MTPSAYMASLLNEFYNELFHVLANNRYKPSKAKINKFKRMYGLWKVL